MLVSMHGISASHVPPVNVSDIKPQKCQPAASTQSYEGKEKCSLTEAIMTSPLVGS